jgi:hypothetical protein
MIIIKLRKTTQGSRKKNTFENNTNLLPPSLKRDIKDISGNK